VIEEKVSEVINSVLNNAEDTKVGSIGISNQMHGILYYDADGNAVSPLYIWQDERGNLPYKDGKTYAQYLGSFAGYGLVTDFYNRENSLVPETAVGVCTIGDYIAMKLTGTKKALMHITNAASFGCFDINKNEFTIDNGMLPEVTADFATVGEWNGIKVSVAVGDNQASFIGSVRTMDGCALVNMGTGGQISMLTDLKKAPDNMEIRPLCSGKNILVGCSLCGGRAFAMVEKLFREIAVLSGNDVDSMYPQINALLEEKFSSSLVGDCRFCGTRNDPSVKGSIMNISEDNFTAADIAYSVLNGMSEELFNMYKNGGMKAKELVCSGNGIRKNAALRRIVSGMFGCEIKIPFYAEEASYGAALAASVACGCNADISEACRMIKYKEN
jgi:sedoheptulokinase